MEGGHRWQILRGSCPWGRGILQRLGAIRRYVDPLDPFNLQELPDRG